MSCGLPSSTSLGPLASLIHARASHHAIRFAPDLCYVARPGWSGWHGELTLWMLLAPAPALPGRPRHRSCASRSGPQGILPCSPPSTTDTHRPGALLSQCTPMCEASPASGRRDGRHQRCMVDPRAERPDLTLAAGRVWWTYRPAERSQTPCVLTPPSVVRSWRRTDDRDLQEVTTAVPPSGPRAGRPAFTASRPSTRSFCPAPATPGRARCTTPTNGQASPCGSMRPPTAVRVYEDC